MSGLKTFDEFSSKPVKKTKSTNEGLFNKKKNKAKGKDVYKQGSALGAKKGFSGSKRHVVKWKNQNDGNFIIKIINDADVLDTGGKLTADGQKLLTDYFNGEQQFIYTNGQLDDTYFTKNVLVYTVKKDNDRKQKIQFTKVPREGLDVELDPSIKYISALDLANQPLIQQQKNILDTTPLVIDPDPDECPEGQALNPDTGECEPAGPDPLPEDCAQEGKKFEYQSGADGEMYTVTINNLSSYYAQRKDGKVAGYVSLQGDGVNDPIVIMWAGDDGSTFEMTNAKDKEFFTKAFQDSEYLCDLIAEYEEKYPDGEDTLTSFKDLLYYASTSQKIYGKAPGGKEGVSIVI